METVKADGCSCCGGSSCGCLPAEFGRLRYYFGQRLGVIDFSDEQAYLVGKSRFHNLRCHGVGVLCGLNVERYAPSAAAAAPPGTVLRVSRGAAFDACGREILVPADQCIDVAAWFAKRRKRADLAAWAAGETHRLWVVLRYRECPSDPAPAPRDPCGCDSGGCEFGRVREAFELALLTDDEHEDACLGAIFPPANDLRAGLVGLAQDVRGTLSARDQLDALLVALTAAGCPDPRSDGWLCLATVQVTVGPGAAAADPPRVTQIDPPDASIAERPTLLSTSALQFLLGELAATATATGDVGPGPSFGELQFSPGAATNSGTLRVVVNLATEGGAPVPLAAGTFDPASVLVTQFDGNVWAEVTPHGAGDVAYDEPGHSVTITWGAGLLAANARYRHAIVAPLATPVVDARARPLRPAPFARMFRLVADGPTSLKIADVLS